jgi:hypothetical protein
MIGAGDFQPAANRCGDQVTAIEWRRVSGG